MVPLEHIRNHQLIKSGNGKTKPTEKGIVNYLVVDAGRTQIPTSSVTVLALGPDEDEILDELTGDLKLL